MTEIATETPDDDSSENKYSTFGISASESGFKSFCTYVTQLPKNQTKQKQKKKERDREKKHESQDSLFFFFLFCINIMWICTRLINWN